MTAAALLQDRNAVMYLVPYEEAQSLPVRLGYPDELHAHAGRQIGCIACPVHIHDLGFHCEGAVIQIQLKDSAGMRRAKKSAG